MGGFFFFFGNEIKINPVCLLLTARFSNEMNRVAGGLVMFEHLTKF